MTAGTDDSNELHVVILGTSQKHVLFKKLCTAADKFERHVHYNDVFYLTVKSEEGEDVVEITDPGTAHTGNREMAIRRADFALLYFSAFSTTSYNQVASVVPDFETKKNPPIRVICDVDETVEEEEDTSSTGISSTSEGYESDTENAMVRRNSMSRIRRQNEEGTVTQGQTNDLLAQLGTNAQLLTLASGRFDEARSLLEEIVREARAARKKSGGKRRFIKLGSREGSKSRDASKNRSRDASKSRNSSASNIENRSSDEMSKEGGSRPASRRSSQKDSKVCSIM